MEHYGIDVRKQYLNFSAAHFVIFSSGQREPLHGHNYYISVEMEGFLTEQRDLFIDFCDIKPIVRAIGDSLDHKVLLQGEHPALSIVEQSDNLEVTFADKEQFVFPKDDVLVLPLANTTAELLARYIYGKTVDGLSEEYGNSTVLRITVSVEETAGQSASYTRRFDEPQRLATLPR